MIDVLILFVQFDDGYCIDLLVCCLVMLQVCLLWLLVLGVVVCYYLLLVEVFVVCGFVVYLYEWCGNGSSSLCLLCMQDWGYCEIFQCDLLVSLVQVQVQGSVLLIIGGYSFGGQFVCVFVGFNLDVVVWFWLVVSGMLYWCMFFVLCGWILLLIYCFLLWLVQCQGVLYGCCVGFGGIEVCGLIGDWVCVGLSNYYCGEGIVQDFDFVMCVVCGQVMVVIMVDDWLVLVMLMQGLLVKLLQV